MFSGPGRQAVTRAGTDVGNNTTKTPDSFQIFLWTHTHHMLCRQVEKIVIDTYGEYVPPYFHEAEISSLDLSNFNTEKVTDMSGMLVVC